MKHSFLASQPNLGKYGRQESIFRLTMPNNEAVRTFRRGPEEAASSSSGSFSVGGKKRAGDMEQVRLLVKNIVHKLEWSLLQ
jgi:hypothetical protein